MTQEQADELTAKSVALKLVIEILNDLRKDAGDDSVEWVIEQLQEAGE